MKKAKSPQSAEEIVLFMCDFAGAYMSCGGPTSRLEDVLGNIGALFGYTSEVFATPTGVFVNVHDAAGRSHTSLKRIKGTGINLERMCWLEGILEDVFSGKLSLSNAKKIIHSKASQKAGFNSIQRLIAAFITGFALSFPSYGNGAAAFGSGLICAITMWMTGEGLSRRIDSSIFRDFIGCMVTLTLAAVCQWIWPFSFDAYSIGGIVILAPGLALTTAISELADQNLLSGTARLMQAVITLFALVLAYLLFADISASFNVQSTLVVARKVTASKLISTGFLMISLFCFGVIFKVPKKSLIWTALTGLIGWGVLNLMNSAHLPGHGATAFGVAAPFLAAFFVGFFSLLFSHLFKVPSQVFSVPGIIALLPGILALTSIQSFALGKEVSGIELAFQVIQKASAITFGLFTARIPFAIRLKRKNNA